MLNSKSPVGTTDEKSTVVEGELGQAQLAQNPLLAAVKSLKIESKNKLMAIWFSKERVEGSLCLDTLFCLDDYWGLIYDEHRISKGFSAANVIANERVLSFVYGS